MDHVEQDDVDEPIEAEDQSTEPMEAREQSDVEEPVIAEVSALHDSELVEEEVEEELALLDEEPIMTVKGGTEDSTPRPTEHK